MWWNQEYIVVSYVVLVYYNGQGFKSSLAWDFSIILSDWRMCTKWLDIMVIYIVNQHISQSFRLPPYCLIWQYVRPYLIIVWQTWYLTWQMFNDRLILFSLYHICDICVHILWIVWHLIQVWRWKVWGMSFVLYNIVHALLCYVFPLLLFVCV